MAKAIQTDSFVCDFNAGDLCTGSSLIDGSSAIAGGAIFDAGTVDLTQLTFGNEAGSADYVFTEKLVTFELRMRVNITTPATNPGEVDGSDRDGFGIHFGPSCPADSDGSYHFDTSCGDSWSFLLREHNNAQYPIAPTTPTAEIQWDGNEMTDSEYIGQISTNFTTGEWVDLKLTVSSHNVTANYNDGEVYLWVPIQAGYFGSIETSWTLRIMGGHRDLETDHFIDDLEVDIFVDTTLPDATLTISTAPSTITFRDGVYYIRNAGVFVEARLPAEQANGASWVCSIDGTPDGVCFVEDNGDPTLFEWEVASPGDGTHILNSTVTDKFGNVEAEPNILEVVFDNSAPSASITNGPAEDSIIAATTVEFEFTGSDVDSVSPVYFTCALSCISSNEECTSPYTTDVLPDGECVFTLTPIDYAGNVGSAQTRTFNIELPPTVEISLWHDAQEFSTGEAGRFDELTLSIEFSEPVLGFNLEDDLTLTPTEGREMSVVSNTNNETIVVSLTFTDETTFTMSIPEAVVTDDVGADNSASNEITHRIDLTPPSLTVNVVSDNSFDTAFAAPNDTVTITIAATEDVTEPTVTFDGQTLTLTETTAMRDWEVSVEMTESTEDGPVSLLVDGYEDLVGNEGPSYTEDTADSFVTFDNSPPNVTVTLESDNTISNGHGRPGASVTVVITADEPITEPTVMINDNLVDVSASKQTLSATWSGIYVLSDDDGNGELDVEVCCYNDQGGNNGPVQDTPSTNVIVDDGAPIVILSPVTTDGINPEYAKIGDNITVTTINNEMLHNPIIRIAGNDVVPVWTGTGYRAVYSMRASDPEGFVTVTIPTPTDFAGNSRASLVSVTSIVFDLTEPTVTITASANGQSINDGDYTNAAVVTFTFTISEQPEEFFVGSLANLTDTCPGAFSFTGTQFGTYFYTLECPADDGEQIGVGVAGTSIIDLAGNSNINGSTLFIHSDTSAPASAITEILPNDDGDNTLDHTRIGHDFADITISYNDDSPVQEQLCRLVRVNTWPQLSVTIVQDWADCAPSTKGVSGSSVLAFTDLSSGDYSFQVQATDVAGNQEDVVMRNWTISECDTTLYCDSYNIYCVEEGDWDLVPSIDCDFCNGLYPDLFRAGCWDVYLRCAKLFPNNYARDTDDLVDTIYNNIIVEHNDTGCMIPSQSASPSPSASPSASPSPSPSASTSATASHTPSPSQSLSYSASVSYSPTPSRSRDPPQWLVSKNVAASDLDGFAFVNNTFTISGDLLRYSDIDAIMEVECEYDPEFMNTTCHYVLTSTARIINPNGYTGFRIWNIYGEQNNEKEVLAEVDLEWLDSLCIWVDDEVCEMLPLSDNPEKGVMMQFRMRKYEGDNRTSPLLISWVDRALVPHSMKPEINDTLLEFEVYPLPEGEDLSVDHVWEQADVAFIIIFVFAAVLISICIYSCFRKKVSRDKKEEVYVLNTDGLRTVHHAFGRSVTQEQLRSRNKLRRQHWPYVMVILAWRIARSIVFTITFFMFMFQIINKEHFDTMDQLDPFSIHVQGQIGNLSIAIEDYYRAEKDRIDEQYAYQTNACDREAVMEAEFNDQRLTIQAYHDDEMEIRRNSQLTTQPVLYSLSNTRACSTAGATVEVDEVGCVIVDSLVTSLDPNGGQVCEEPTSRTPDEWREKLRDICRARGLANSTEAPCVGFSYDTTNNHYYIFQSFGPTEVSAINAGYCYGYNTVEVLWPGDSVDAQEQANLLAYQLEVNRTIGQANDLLQSLRNDEHLHLTFDPQASSFGVDRIYLAQIASLPSGNTYDVWATYGCPACPDEFEPPTLQELRRGEITYRSNETVAETAAEVNINVDEEFVSMIQEEEAYFPDLVEYPRVDFEFWKIGLNNRIPLIALSIDAIMFVYRTLITIAIVSRYLRGVKKVIPLTLVGQDRDVEWAKGICAGCCFGFWDWMYRKINRIDQTLWMLLGKLILLTQLALLACVILLAYWVVDEAIDVETFEQAEVFSTITGAPAAQRIIRNEQIALYAHGFNEIMAFQLKAELRIKASELTSRQREFNLQEQQEVIDFNEAYCTALQTARAYPFLLDTNLEASETTLGASLPFTGLESGGAATWRLNNPAAADGVTNYIIDQVTFTMSWLPPDTSGSTNLQYSQRRVVARACSDGVVFNDTAAKMVLMTNDDCTDVDQPWCSTEDNEEALLNQVVNTVTVNRNKYALEPADCGDFPGCTNGSPCLVSRSTSYPDQDVLDNFVATVELLEVTDELAGTTRVSFTNTISVPVKDSINVNCDAILIPSRPESLIDNTKISNYDVCTGAAVVNMEAIIDDVELSEGLANNETIAARFLRITIDPSLDLSIPYYQIDSVEVIGHTTDDFECDEVEWQELNYQPDEVTLGECDKINPIHGRMMRIFDKQEWTAALVAGYSPFITALRNIALAPFYILIVLICVFIVVEMFLSILEWFLIKTDLIRQNTYAEVPCAIARNVHLKESQAAFAQKTQTELRVEPSGTGADHSEIEMMPSASAAAVGAGVGAGAVAATATSKAPVDDDTEDDANNTGKKKGSKFGKPSFSRNKNKPSGDTTPTEKGDNGGGNGGAGGGRGSAFWGRRTSTKKQEEFTSMEQFRESDAWQEYTTPEGRPYFYNPHTNETVWTRPEP